MAKAAQGIEVIARGVCVRAGRLLLCHCKGAANTYLPGGHVEFGEAAAYSLVREVQEELGVGSKAGRFLGAVEHTYWRRGKPQCEVNLVFLLSIPGLSARQRPASQEEYIEFLWVPLEQLRHSGLEPHPLRRLLPAWLDRAKGRATWASTFASRKR